MWNLNYTLAVAVIVAVAPSASPLMAASPAEAKAGPVQVVAVVGSKLRQVTLTPKAALRLDIQTELMSEEPVGTKVAPYASVFYDVAGHAWVYTNPAPLTYLRQSVVVERIAGANALLRDGPPAGTAVVTVGVAQLYGAEKGVGH